MDSNGKEGMKMKRDYEEERCTYIGMWQFHSFIQQMFTEWPVCARYCADLAVIKIFLSISFSEFNLPCVPLYISIEMQDTEMNMGSYEHLWTFNF